MLLDVDRGQDVVLDESLRQDDRVLEVVTLPGHERDEQVAPERHLTLVGARTVGEDLSDLHASTVVHDRTLVEARALVGATELLHAVGAVVAVVLRHGDVIGRDLGHHARSLSHDDVTSVGGTAVFHAGADERRLAAEQRDGLTLHVGSHERAVGVVVLEERDHRRRDRHHLARRDVHVVDDRARHVVDLFALGTHENARLSEGAVRVQRRVGLSEDVEVLHVGGHVVDLVGDPAVDDLAVGRLDETEGIDPSERGQRSDETDVGTLGGLDRAHAAVVRRVNVADLEAGTLTRKTARTERGQTTLVRQAGQRVGLVHELRQLAGAEELLDGGNDGPDVDQRLRRDRLDVLGGHALADDALHPGQTRADLVLDELADGAKTTVAEVVDVVGLDAHGVATGCDELGLARVEADEVLDRRDDVFHRHGALRQRKRCAELLVDLVATDLGEVVALGVEVEVVEEGLARLSRRGLARTQLAVDVLERLVLVADAILLEGGDHRLVGTEALTDLVGAHPKRLEQHRHGLLALAVDADADEVLLVDLELEPRTARRDDLGDVDVLVRGLVERALEVDAGRTHQLRDHDTLGAVDDEGALVGHEREIAHEDRLGLDLTGLVVHELCSHEQRRRIGEVLVAALLDGVLRRLKPVVTERQRHGAAEVLDGRDLLEDVFEARRSRDVLPTGLERRRNAVFPQLVAEQPVERLRLESQEVGDLQRLADLGERDPKRARGDRGNC